MAALGGPSITGPTYPTEQSGELEIGAETRKQRQTIDGESIAEQILSNLNEIGRCYIRDFRNDCFSDEQLAAISTLQDGFRINPDDRLQHDPRWHQWGITTHTRMVFNALIRGGEVEQVLRKNQLAEEVQYYMSKQIDGIGKRELFIISSSLHDLGKYARGFVVNGEGIPKPEYEGHEALSGKLIRGNGPALEFLKSQGLSHSHIEYIASCAELHYELGKVRRFAKQRGDGYTLKFVDSTDFQDAIRDTLIRHEDFALEIGLFFLGDNFAKTALRIIKGLEGTITINTAPQIPAPISSELLDTDLFEARPLIIEQLQKQKAMGENIDERLLDSVLQLPANEKSGLCFIRTVIDKIPNSNSPDIFTGD